MAHHTQLYKCSKPLEGVSNNEYLECGAAMADCQEVMVWVGMKKLSDDEGILIGADGPQ